MVFFLEFDIGNEIIVSEERDGGDDGCLHKLQAAPPACITNPTDPRARRPGLGVSPFNILRCDKFCRLAKSPRQIYIRAH
jgi:hypothetical protein